ncbi:choice-of-anchor L domain-containing protein, partial [Myxococcota bacterium]|nr:choice-of-anchor L domain-containing protein [Myxococcota bacterium]
NAKSFSFDFNFFSAEYPGYVKKDFNDTFYAILRADSTNQGATTNISFDANRNSIEVDNNYFQQPFHPIPNTGTGFDAHGSTGWLRTAWPIKGGEKFTLTFSVHDEGDGVYDSLVVLDNFQWHDFEAVGTTDPLN